MARRGSNGFFGRLKNLSHRESYYYATGGKVTQRNLAPTASRSPYSDAADVRSRRGPDADEINHAQLREALDQAMQTYDPDESNDGQQ